MQKSRSDGWVNSRPGSSRDPRLDFSEWLHNELVTEFARESEQFATDRVKRVQDRLNETRRGLKPLQCVILWISPPVAFTLHGDYVYISRRLLERLPADDATAFVLGHEAAHHDLGHLDLFGNWANWLPQSDATAYLAALANWLEHRTYGPARETDADEYAIRLCKRAGYDVDVAGSALKTLEMLMLDAGDISGVFGPENLLDPTDPHRDSTAYRAETWLWSHMQGYDPMYERVKNVQRLARGLWDGSIVA